MFAVPVLDIYVTGACNLKCGYCFGENDRRKPIERATFEAALNFAHVVHASTIELCGGEPLLYPDLEWAAETAASKGFKLILRTNGLYLAKKRHFVARMFDSVGLSLDGDAEANERMRPDRGHSLGPAAKFETVLREVFELKALRPDMHLVLASVATAHNVLGLRNLASILKERAPPIDLWKVYQFVDNNFRAKENSQEFTLDMQQLCALREDLSAVLDGQIPVKVRNASDIDGRCLVVNRDGDVLLGAASFGNLGQDRVGLILERLEQTGRDSEIFDNKTLTYQPLLAGPIGQAA